jgi:hypothetical protein
LTNQLQSTFFLTYQWKGKSGENHEISFDGLTKLKLINMDKEKKLTGIITPRNLFAVLQSALPKNLR